MSLPQSPPEGCPPQRIILPAHCGTAAAPAVHRALLDTLDSGAVPVIDGGEVETLGQSVLQLLLAARTAAPTMTIDPLSPTLAGRLHALKVASALGIPDAEASAA